MRRSRAGAVIAAACVAVGLTAATGARAESWLASDGGAGTAQPAGTALANGLPAQTATQAGLAQTLPGAQVGLAQALPVAQASPGNAATAQPLMAHQTVVEVRGWRHGTKACESAIADTKSAPSVRSGCASPELTSSSPPGYSPAQLRKYLHLSGDGSGQTIAIVDAYDNPNAAADLTGFSKQFGLPLPCGAAKTAGCFPFSVVQPFGTAAADPGWAVESDLDVQTVHAIAPRASIVLVEAYDAMASSLFDAIDYAASLGASVISNSYGGSESDSEAQDDAHCALQASLCVAATGDSGNPGLYPAYNPYVLSVGGTTLGLTAEGKKTFEVAWCCNTGATGGGLSQYLPRPTYQGGVTSYPNRTIPDVSFDADPMTGVPVLDTFGLYGQVGWFLIGGTSAGAPAWSAIIAVADQLRAARGKAPLHGAGFQAQTLIYQIGHSAFDDITRGADNVFACAGLPVSGCHAGPGYDLVTGWGSPSPGIDSVLAAAP